MKNKLALIAFILTWMLVASPAMAVVPKVLSVDATGKQVTVDSAGRFIYIPDQKYNSLIIVDSSTLLVDDTISLPGAPQDIALDESAGKIYVTVSGFFEVLAFDISTYVPETSLSLPQAGNEIVVGHNYIYVTTLESGSGIMRVDKTTGNYVDSFSLGVSTYQRGAIEITPDKSKLIFANRGLSPGTVAVFDITGSDPVLLIKNEHGTLGGNGQGISVDPINGSFFSYAVGGGNGTGYGIAKLGIDDLSWFGELVTGPYPRAIHYSANGITAYTNNAVNEVKVWDHILIQLTGTIPVLGNPQDFADAQGSSLLAVISDQEFAIYQVGEFTPEPPAPKLEGFVDGAVLTKVVCRNKSTGVRLRLSINANTFDCVAAGLEVNPGDLIKIVLEGAIAE
jgi:hypothetical protein